MHTFLCTYEKTLFRDEKTGYTIFAVRTDNADVPRSEYGNTVCIGNIVHYPVGVPLRVSGNVQTDANGHVYIRTEGCVPESGNAAAGITFLSGGQFPGIGLKKAELVMSAVGNNLFSFCRKDGAEEELSKIKGLNKEESRLIVNRVNMYAVMQDLLVWISKYGGTCKDAEDIYEIYGNSSIEKIEENPYFGGFFSLSYYAREAIARGKGFRTHDQRRLHALVNEAFRIAESGGSTCLTWERLFRFCSAVEKKANMGYVTNPVCIAAHILEKRGDYTVSRSRGRSYVYRNKMYEAERRIAGHVRRLMGTRLPFMKGSVEKVQEALGISYNEEQKKAVELAGMSGIVIMIGGPGTGKSTSTQGMLHYFRQVRPEGRFALCAPTGSAAKMLRERTGEDAQTICRLMGVRPYDDEMLACRDEQNQLPYDMIIADEFSMVDTEQCMMLLSGVKNGALLVLSGDEDQLASVGPGNVFHDLISSGLFPVVRLTEVYRQKEGSSILENAARIRKGEADMIEDESTSLLYVDTEEEAEKAVLNAVCRDYGGTTRLFTPVKNQKYLIGRYNMNRKIRSIKRRGKKEPELTYGGISFAKGDPIIMCRNNYRTGYMNGDEGTVLDVHLPEEGKLAIDIDIDGETITLTGKDLDDIDLSYALTIHRAQGSECLVAVIVVPEKPAGMLVRNLVYVAATRAKNRNIFIIQGRDSLKKAIRTDSRPMRQTGLREMLLDAG